MKQVLVFSTLKSQINYHDNYSITQTEPIHPYIGVLWSNIIKKNKVKIDYLNTTNFTNLKKYNFFYKYLFLPRNYSTIIVHSTSGLGKASLIKIFNWNLNIVYYSLSKINPNGNIIQILIRKALFFTDILLSNHIIYGLNHLEYSMPLKLVNKKKTYFPILTDYNFFQSNLYDTYNLKFELNGFFLIVGDITRDDEFIYDELSCFQYPIVRITRDPVVIKNVENLINKNRGDVILSGVSFLDLANFYNKARCCIVASKFDDWQPGGITSIAEALSCNGICVCNSGGEIELEFNSLASENNIENPLIYYNYPSKNSLRKVISDFNNLTEDDIQKIRISSNNFANKSLNFNIKGMNLLNHIINDHIK